MSIRGVYGRPFLNLDSLIDINTYQGLINEMLIGISKSWVDKGVVSCGSRVDEKKLELCEVLRNPQNFLNPEQVETLIGLSNLHQKAWYCSLLLPVHHPYSLVFIRRERNFIEKHLENSCEWTGNAQYFPKTCEFVKSLPFEQVGRILFFMSEPNAETLIHYDSSTPESRGRPNTEMIYFRPFLRKKLFIWDETTSIKHHLVGHASYWNDMDWHGVDPSDTKSISLRIDGVFNSEFRKLLAAGQELKY